MNTDDLLCVGAVDNILVSSTIGRNKMLIPGEVISAIINGTDELLAELREMGIGIYPTGGETADVGDLVRTIIVDDALWNLVDIRIETYAEKTLLLANLFYQLLSVHCQISSLNS